jgi:hypothetical protein
MKEPILEYLQASEPEIKTMVIGKSENDPGMDIKELTLDRKRTMHDWDSKVKGVNIDKTEKKIQ